MLNKNRQILEQKNDGVIIKTKMENQLSSIEKEIEKLEQHLDFLEKVEPLQNEIKIVSDQISAGISFEIEKIIQEINFTSVISNLELSYLNKQILVTKSLREKQFLIKLVHLNIFEFSNAYNKKLKLLKTIIPSKESYSMAFKHISKHLAVLRNRHSFDNNMKFIRNNMAAHKELTLNEYIKKNTLLNEAECLPMISDFKHFHSLLFMFISFLLESHYEGISENFDVEATFKKLSDFRDNI